MPTCAIVSFRLGGADGVAIEAAKWARALEALGFAVSTVAGEGVVDHQVEGLRIRDESPVDRSALAAALDADLCIVENLCSLPLNPSAAEAVAELRRGRPTVLHHHDLPWQRPAFLDPPPPPTDPAWVHVTINERSRRELAERGLAATTCYNRFDPTPPRGDRVGLRQALGLASGDRLVLQPTRALVRKGIDRALEATAALGATAWLLGPPEDGFDDELEGLLESATCPVRRGWPPGSWSIHDAYAAADVICMASSWEGFGNPTLESATHRRPLVLNRYPVARELERFGFCWFGLDELAQFEALGTEELAAVVDTNHQVASQHFNVDDLPAVLNQILEPLARSLR